MGIPHIWPSQRPYMRASGTESLNGVYMAFWAKDEVRWPGASKGQHKTIRITEINCLEDCPALQVGHKKLFLFISLIVNKSLI